jgi:cobalamin synthase
MASGRVSQVSFLLIGVLAVWRFRSSFLPLAVTTVWLLVAAADLEQLCKRYPAEASPLRQRVFVRRRLKNLVVVGLVSAAVVPVAGWMSVELRLVAVIVLAAVFAGQLLRGLRLASAGGFAGDDDDV